jgi:hypothetical protein
MNAVSSSPNSAANYWNVIQKRNARQQERITQGLGSGQITAAEKESLDKSKAALDDMAAKANADGTICNDEFTGLMQAYNDRSKEIKALKHNGQAADGVKPATGAPANAEEIIAKRSANLSANLAQSVQSGKITAEETQRVTDQQATVDKLLTQAKSDGSINSAEFTQIMHAQNQERHMIRHLRHNPYAQAAMQSAAQSATQASNQEAAQPAAGTAEVTGVQAAAATQAVKPINVTV